MRGREAINLKHALVASDFFQGSLRLETECKRVSAGVLSSVEENNIFLTIIIIR